MLYVYGDDSSDEKRERVIAVGVVVGTEAMWAALEPKWKARNNGIPFHAKDCESDKGDYANSAHKKNKDLYRDLVTLLVEGEVGGLGIAIDLVAQKKIFPHSLDLAYYKAFVDVLDRTRAFAARYGEIAKFTFDISTENEYNAGLIYATVRENDPSAFAHLDPEISFVPARQSARVQTGDLMAYEAMKALDHTVGPHKRTRRSWEALRATERFETFSYSEEWFTDFKKNLVELEQKVGYNQQHYLDWLKAKNRQHSLSNMFFFTGIRWKEDKGK